MSMIPKISSTLDLDDVLNDPEQISRLKLLVAMNNLIYFCIRRES